MCVGGGGCGAMGVLMVVAVSQLHIQYVCWLGWPTRLVWRSDKEGEDEGALCE